MECRFRNIKFLYKIYNLKFCSFMMAMSKTKSEICHMIIGCKTLGVRKNSFHKEISKKIYFFLIKMIKHQSWIEAYICSAYSPLTIGPFHVMHNLTMKILYTNSSNIFHE